MGELRQAGRGTLRGRPSRLLAAGTTGLAMAVTMLMVLSPVSAGATVHPATVLKAPYKGTTSSPNWYGSATNCGVAKGSAGKWVPTTGGITASDSASAKTCGKNIGYVGGGSYAYWSAGVTIAIPIKILTTANHSIGVSFTLTVASAQSYSHGLCPTKFITWPPAKYTYESAGCQTYADVYFDLGANLIDITNSSWYHHNYTYVDVYNDSYWSNYSSCYNYGTPSCYNQSGNYSYHGAYSYNAPGATTCSLSGTCTFTMWTNSTAPMPRTDRWMLEIYLYTSADASASYSNVAGPFVGSAAASVNMATLGNGAKVTSVTVV